MGLIEQLAGNRGKELFGVESANIQAHSRAQAIAAAMFALLEPGATILGLDPALGGYLTYGMQINFSSNPYNVVPHHVSEKDMPMDRAEVKTLAQAHHRKLTVDGWSTDTRQPNFAEFRRIADLVGVYLLVNMGHFVDLVATGLHPNPVPYAAVVTATTHKSLNIPHGGLIRSKEHWHAQINSTVFHGRQVGTMEHVIKTQTVAFKIAVLPEFTQCQQRTLEGKKVLAVHLLAGRGSAAVISVVNGATSPTRSVDA